MSCAVSVHHASVTYARHLALREVSLDIHRRDFVGIIGPNGSGKTTLLTVMNGLGRIRSGAIRVTDRDVRPHGFTALRRRIGYVPQHVPVDPRAPITCFEAVLIGRYGRLGLLRRPGPEDRKKAEETLALVRIGHLRDRPFGQVSGGERQKVNLARALVQEPELLLLDEPTANLDPPSVGELLALIADVYERFQLTVVMVTHHLAHLPGVCRRVVMMKQGRILFDGPRADALASSRLAELYGE